ncbi:Transcriptional regulator, MarR family [Clostridium bornimense]|uniref:HTH-type transcriptional regulator SarZ n=1 Tax=Clostridium bornimense TaxID=1216932 RepID=W6S600_9CLOT|nr:MarR family transcriptional regulator [Clostridium bornimense]CDM69777.1 Transcriptional regulator, MarR family [Clostridium bornimense]
MDKSLSMINEILVDIFKNILSIQHEYVVTRGEINVKNLSYTEMHTISAIGEDSSKSMSEVAKELGVTVGTLTIAINNLVKKGYVSRTKDQLDRRVVLITLTDKGKKVCRIHDEFHEKMVKATIDGLTKEEEEFLTKALWKLDCFIKDKGEEVVSRKG